MSTVLSPTETSVKKEPELIDVHAVAYEATCSWRTVYRLSDAGLMPAPIRLGSLVRWRRAEILAWIAAGCPRVRDPKGMPQ